MGDVLVVVLNKDKKIDTVLLGTRATGAVSYSCKRAEVCRSVVNTDGASGS
jgi:hypothetical protein